MNFEMHNFLLSFEIVFIILFKFNNAEHTTSMTNTHYPLSSSGSGYTASVAAAAAAPISATVDGSPVSIDGHHLQSHEHPPSYHVASINFENVETPFAIALWVFIATLAKLGFHMANRLSSIFPESVLLIVLGVVIGVLLFYTQLMVVSPLTPTTFFMFMLPPIVLDAGYFMPNRLFFDNLGTILLFAVVGTVFNTMTIGVSLWALGLTGLYGVDLNILDSFLFSALICAVDPVAVLAVFEEIHVNEVLYIVVFGESLLNDAVTVVLYHMFEAYTEMGEERIVYTDVFLGFASFFVVAIGGTAIGVAWGFLTGFVTRFTNHVRVIEPLLVFIMAYLSHLTAEMFHLSGILAITFCGICAKNYVEANISLKSHTTIKYAMKMISSTSETIIFLFLGVSTVNDYHEWNTWFVIFTILFCTVYRALGVLILTWLANHFRLHKLNKVEEFVMAYGGLRGAVAFALALTINAKVVHHKSMFLTATIAMVYFTVFVQGITIKPLVELLRVKKSSKRKMTMNERIHERFMDHLMAGIEDVAGHLGNHHLRDKFKYYDHKYFRKWLCRENHAAEPKILETFSKLNLRDAKEFLTQNGSFVPSNYSTTEANLATLFRNYTQSNFEGCNQSNNTLTPNDSSVCNLDMQELDYSPSTKDLNDAKLHHILSDAMFKAPRRHRKYSRSVIHDQEPSHPPFRHMMRMQIRHILSEQSKNHKKGREKRRHLNGGAIAGSSTGSGGGAISGSGSSATVHPRNQRIPTLGNGHIRFKTPDDYVGDATGVVNDGDDDDDDVVAVVKTPTKAKATVIVGDQAAAMTTTKTNAPYFYVNEALDTDEDGIVFTAPPTGGTSSVSDRLIGGLGWRTPSPSGASTPLRDTQRTATETQLPWRRIPSTESSGGFGNDGGTGTGTGTGTGNGSGAGSHVGYECDSEQPIVQQEFPSWVDNRDYNAYVSPTSTFLNRLEPAPPPPVYHIFREAQMPHASSSTPSLSSPSDQRRPSSSSIDRKTGSLTENTTQL